MTRPIVTVAFSLLSAMAAIAQQAPPRTANDSLLAGFKNPEYEASRKKHQSVQHQQMQIDSVAVKKRAAADSTAYKIKMHQAMQHKRVDVDSSLIKKGHN